MQISKPHRTMALAALATVSLTTAVSAQAADEAPESAYIAALRGCQAQADATARLACFDKAATEIVGASDAGDLRLVDREEVRKTRRGLFGFSLPDFGIFGKRDGAKEEEIDEIETTIASVSGSYATGYTIRTAEGAVWQIADVPPRLMKPKAGDALLIKSGALSAYYLRIGTQAGVKATRIK